MDRPALIALVGIYIGLLKWLYIAAVVPAYGYTGLRYQRPGGWEEILTWVLALAPAVWMPVDIARPSRLPLWFQYLVVYVPTTFVPLYNAAPGDRPIWPMVAAILCALIIVQAITSLPPARIPTLSVTAAVSRGLLVGLAGALLVPIVATFGIPTHLPSLAEVYDVRGDYKAVLANSSPLVVYMVAWFGRVAAPLLVLVGVLQRRWTFVLLGLLGAAYGFSVSGMKTILLAGFFLIGLRMLYRPEGRRMGIWLTAALVGGIVASVIGDVVTGTNAFVGILVRRGLMIPGLLNGYYYQFYSTHPLTYLGSSFLRALAGYQYDAPPPAIIGSVYFGSTLVNANVNVWGDAFLSFGLVGIIVFAIVLGGVLWAFDSVSTGRSRAMTCLMLGIPALTLTNSALPTTFLTNGLALTFVVAALLPAVGAFEAPSPAGLHRAVLADAHSQQQ